MQITAVQAEWVPQCIAFCSGTIMTTQGEPREITGYHGRQRQTTANTPLECSRPNLQPTTHDLPNALRFYNLQITKYNVNVTICEIQSAFTCYHWQITSYHLKFDTYYLSIWNLRITAGQLQFTNHNYNYHCTNYKPQCITYNLQLQLYMLQIANPEITHCNYILAIYNVPLTPCFLQFTMCNFTIHNSHFTT